jgi:hypothetical protein
MKLRLLMLWLLVSLTGLNPGSLVPGTDDAASGHTCTKPGCGRATDMEEEHRHWCTTCRHYCEDDDRGHEP